MHPVLLQFGRFVLPAYGAFAALAVGLGLGFTLRSARMLGLDAAKVWNIVVLGLVTTLATARLVVLVQYWPRLGQRALSIGLLGAPASLALLIATALAVMVCLGYAWRTRMPLLRTADALAPGLALAGSIADMGCFEAGCAYGTPTRMPWAVVFSDPHAARWTGTPLGVPLHPVQLYASVLDFLIFVLLVWVLERTPPGELAGGWLFLTGVTQSMVDPFRGDLAGAAFVWRQAIECLFVVAGGLLWLRRSWTTEAVHV